MENHSYDQIIGNPQAPYINALAKQGAIATAYHAVAHPSLPNYLALAGGSTFGITSDCTTCWVAAGNIADSLEAAGKSWKGYMESMPSTCFVGDSYPYVQKHDPFVYFNDVRGSASRCHSHVVPYSQLAVDLASAATTPNFAFITPNACNDMHDCSISQGDSWLQQQVPSILASPAFTSQHSLLAVTWDEDDFTTANQVPLILVGGGITAGFQTSAPYNHYSLLRTTEAAFGLGTLTSIDASATSITGVFAWSSIGGATTSNAAVASGTPGRLDLVTIGQDGALWHRSWDGTAWQPWSSVGGVPTSGPAAAAPSSGRLDVFVRGADMALWQRTWNGTSWQAWSSVGGVMTSAPAAVSWSSTRLDAFARGADGSLWHRYWDGTGWQSWERVGGALSSDPGAVTWGSGRLDVFVRGVDGSLWHRAWNGASWQPWEPLGGALATAATATSCGAGRIDVFAVGIDDGMWWKSFNGTAWSGWTPLFGQWTSSPSAACDSTTGMIDLFARGADGAAWHTTLHGT